MRVIEPLANTGFAGGCNLGIRAPGEFDFVALVNNDATVDPGWLRPLVDALDERRARRRGVPEDAVRRPLVEAELDVPGRGADRPRPADARRPADGGALRRRARRRPAGLRRGLLPAGAADRDATARRSPAGRGDAGASACGPTTSVRRRAVAARASSSRRASATLRTARTDADGRASHRRPSRSWVDVALDGDAVRRDQQRRLDLYPRGFGGDRGFLERDDGQYDEPAEVFAWCGGAVLLVEGVPRRRRAVRRAAVPLLRGHRPVVARAAARLALRVRAGVGRPPPPRRVVRRRLAGLPLLHRAQPAAGARQERAGRLAVAGRARGASSGRSASTFRDLVAAPADAAPAAPRRSRPPVAGARRLPAPAAGDAARPLAARRPGRDRGVADGVDRRPRRRRGERRACASASTTSTGRRSAAASRSPARSPRRSPADHDVTLLGPEPRRRRAHARAARRRPVGLRLPTRRRRRRRVRRPAPTSTCSSTAPTCSKAINRSAVGWYYVHFPQVPLTRRRARCATASASPAVKALSLPPRLPERLRAGAGRLRPAGPCAPSSCRPTQRYLANSPFTAGWVERLWGVPADVLYPPVRPRSGRATKQPLILNVGPLLRPPLRALQEAARADRRVRRQRRCDGWQPRTSPAGATRVNRDYALAARRAAVGQPVDVHVNATGETVRRLLAEASIYWHAGGLGEDPRAPSRAVRALRHHRRRGDGGRRRAGRVRRRRTGRDRRATASTASTGARRRSSSAHPPADRRPRPAAADVRRGATAGGRLLGAAVHRRRCAPCCPPLRRGRGRDPASR